MIEENEGLAFIGVVEYVSEVFSLSSKTSRRYVISAYQCDPSNIDMLVLEYMNPVSYEIVSCSLHTTDIFVIPSYSIDTIFRFEFPYIASEVSADDRIEFAVNYITWQEDEIRIDAVYFFYYSLDMITTIGRTEMYIACDS